MQIELTGRMMWIVGVNHHHRIGSILVYTQQKSIKKGISFDSNSNLCTVTILSYLSRSFVTAWPGLICKYVMISIYRMVFGIVWKINKFRNCDYFFLSRCFLQTLQSCRRYKCPLFCTYRSSSTIIHQWLFVKNVFGHSCIAIISIHWKSSMWHTHNHRIKNASVQ